MNILVRWSFLLLVAFGGFGLAVETEAQGIVAPRGAVFSALLVPDMRGITEASPFGDMIWLAQESGGESKDYTRESEGSGDQRGYGANLNKGTTKNIVYLLNEANRTCNERIERRYRLDCLRVYYGWIVDSLPDNGDYLPIRQAMRQAEMKLEAIVSANLDRTAPAITPRKGHKPYAKKLPALRAVKKSSVKKAVAQAEAVIKETRIVILRSGGDPTRRTAHYEDVSAALNSNLVILRSA